MRRKLNSISDKMAYDNVEQARAAIFRGSDDYQLHPMEAKAKAYFRLATNHHKLKASAVDIRAYFCQSGEAYLESYEKAGLPRFRDVNLLIHRVLPSLYCFCPEQALTRLFALDEWHYCWPPLPDISLASNSEIPYEAYASIVKYMRQLRQALCGRELDLQLCNESILVLDSLRGIHKSWCSDETSLGFKLLVAIEESSTSEVNTLLQRILTLHQRRALRGSLKRDDAGLISMHGMMLSKVALVAGMSIEIESEFLPLGLLQNN